MEYMFFHYKGYKYFLIEMLPTLGSEIIDL